MKKLLAALSGLPSFVFINLRFVWKRFMALPRFAQYTIGIVIVILSITLFTFLRGSSVPATTENVRFVTLQTISELSGTRGSGSVLGSVRARSEATLFTETGGQVQKVHTTLGNRVGAGFVVAEFENNAELAAVLQAEGAYDAARAAQDAVSPTDAHDEAVNTYRSSFAAIDASVETDIGAFFGETTPYGQDLLINPAQGDPTRLPREKTQLDQNLETWRTSLSSATNRDPLTLLTEAETFVRALQTFVEKLADAANRTNSNASISQLASLTTARTTIASTLASLTLARATYRNSQTTSTASVNAGVKSALGTLRAAQAQLEKTRVRTPIAGVVNFLPLRVGDYVNAQTHVATIANNDALEIVAYVSEDDKNLLAPGTTVSIDGTSEGTITSISPALDPITKQIEVRIAAANDATFVHGQSVRIFIPEIEGSAKEQEVTYLPLASVKLRASDRVVFTLDEENRLRALLVETGDVRGDSIEIFTPLDPSMTIVRDARGLAEGERVQIAP